MYRGRGEATRRFCSRGSGQGDRDPWSQQHDFPGDDLNVESFQLCVERIDPWFIVRQTTCLCAVVASDLTKANFQPKRRFLSVFR